MPTTVLELPFDVVHQRENNPVSQDFLEENRQLFNESCFEVFKALVSGVRLTTDNAKTLAQTRSLPRRIKDLRGEDGDGFKISDKWLLDKDGRRTVKEWYMSDEDRIYNLGVITKKMKAKNNA